MFLNRRKARVVTCQHPQPVSLRTPTMPTQAEPLCQMFPYVAGELMLNLSRMYQLHSRGRHVPQQASTGIHIVAPSLE